MKNNKLILYAFIALFVILVTVFIIMKVIAANAAKNSIQQLPVNNDNPETQTSPKVITATAITTPAINNILYKLISQGGSFPISKGQKSKAVYLLQYILNALYNAGLTLDGDFGSKTQNALAKNTGRTYADTALTLALNAEMQKNKAKIKNFNWYTAQLGYFKTNNA